MHKATFLGGIALLLGLAAACSSEKTPYYNAALVDKAKAVEPFIHLGRYTTERGTTWHEMPDSTHVEPWDYMLYSGAPGIVLYYLELFDATGDSTYLAEAKAGADYVLNVLPDSVPPNWFLGLYTGVSGMGFVLTEAYKHTGEERYKQGALATLPKLQASTDTTEHGLSFLDTDVMYGSAGVGLYLYYLAEAYPEVATEAEALAHGLARGLLDNAMDSVGTSRWKMQATDTYSMDNFSHGTAGIGYFLSETYRRTQDPAYLEAALKAVKGLDLITNENGYVSHHTPGGEDLYYLSWCHGPAGTSRLFYSLHQATQDRQWMDRIEHVAQSMMADRIDSLETPGYWNNVGKCCGAVGVGEFFLWLHQATDKAEYLDFARAMTRTIERKAYPGDTLKWLQAEHRVRPEYLASQSGLMQGNAGIGLWYLKLAAFEQGHQPHILFPDEPKL